MQKITKYLCGIIQQAAKITTKSFNVYAKDEFGDIVTDIDKEVESFLIEKLNRKYPEFDIVSEEFNPDHDLTSNCFVIDPIDGTRNFAVGIPLWGMQIAAIEDGEVISAVIYLPKLNELYYADCDGAFLNGERLNLVSENQNQRPIYEIAGSDQLSVLAQMEKDFVFNYRNISAASVVYSWVAAGRLNGYWLRYNCKWDYIPGMYLVKMAGGYTKNINEQDLHIAATNEKIMETLSHFPLSEDATAKTETKTTATAKPKTTKSTTKKSK